MQRNAYLLLSSIVEELDAVLASDNAAVDERRVSIADGCNTARCRMLLLTPAIIEESHGMP